MRTAMILAAGLGTRLRPLTDTMPKAMVPYQGTPMIESLLYRLRDAGFRRIVINLHHFSDMLREFVMSLDLKDMEILFSDESEQLLDTGGAVKQAADMLIGNGPILIHNVDIISNIDLEEFYTEGLAAINGQNAGALLATNSRTSSRYLLFDEHRELQGWIRPDRDQFRPVGAHPQSANSDTPHYESLAATHIPDTWTRQAFGGIHLLSPDTLPLMATFPKAFSIIDFYLTISPSHPVLTYSPKDLTLQDIGKLSYV